MGPSLPWIYQDHHRGQRMLVRVITSTFTDPRIEGGRRAGLSTGDHLARSLLLPAKEVAVLYHERWHVEVVIDETRTHLRLSARTLRSLTKDRRHSRDLCASACPSGRPHAHGASSDRSHPDQFYRDHPHVRRLLFLPMASITQQQKGLFFALSMAHVFQTILSVDVKVAIAFALTSTLKMVHSAPLLIIDATGTSNRLPSSGIC